MSKIVKWIIGALVAAIVLGVGGSFVYINFIEGDAPPPLSIDSANTNSSTSTTAFSGMPVATDGTWKVTTGSQAGYRVKEVLFGQDATAVGRTSDVTGEVTIEGTEVKTATFSVDLSTVTSDQSNRDRQFQSRIMNVGTYPTADFKLTTPIQMDKIPENGQTTTVKATGDLTMHGTTKQVTTDITVKRDGNTFILNTSIPVTFSDFNIDNPSFGPAQVGDTGTIEVLLNMTKAS